MEKSKIYQKMNKQIRQINGHLEKDFLAYRKIKYEFNNLVRNQIKCT